ncbi:MAG: ABC transporter ATP-binding protein [Chloroflexi bacterium]|nr:ABC transporter ATP-binding protein [Chloroflexota bacterium]
MTTLTQPTVAAPEHEPAAPQPPSRPAIVWALLRGYRGLLAGAVLAGVLMHLCTIASSTLSAYMVGRAATGATSEALWPLFWWLVALILPLAALPWIETILAHIVAFRILADIRARLYDAFERLAPGYLLERRSGDLGATAMGDVETLEIGLSHTLPPLLVVLVVPAGALAALAVLHWSLALALLPFVVAVLTTPLWLGRWADRQGYVVRDRVGEVGAEVVDGVQGLREILVFGAQRRALGLLAEREAALEAAQRAHGVNKGRELAVSDLLVGLGLLAVVALAAWLTSVGALASALLPAAVILAATIFVPINLLLGAGRDFALVFAAGERVYTLLTAPPPVRETATTAPGHPVVPAISFERVHFRYRPQLPEALRGVSFAVRPGETVALVGASGAGKSTCASLLLRLWDVSGGRITVGGYDLRALPQASLRELFASVPQDVYLFNRSVWENIRLGRPDASDSAVVAAAEAAQARAFIEALPESWDTRLGERGASLSGGQRQRIAIARALLKDAPILLLDEAVSNLDGESEQALQTALSTLRRGRTTLVIAHRLSTIRSADRIVVLERGTVVEEGRFNALVTAGGAFSRLVATGLGPGS